METSYLQDPGQCGNVLKGFEGFLSSSKNTALSSLHIEGSVAHRHLYPVVYGMPFLIQDYTLLTKVCGCAFRTFYHG
ncbi:hypothetical protein AAHE18_16G139500 [Arachis hypogaea]